MRDLSEILKIKNTTQNKQLQYGLLKSFCQIFKSTGIAKFTGNSVGFMPVASENLQVNLSPEGNHIDNFSLANGEITAIRNELILRK